MDRVVVPADQLPKPPQTLEDFRAYAVWIAEAVATGRIDYRTAGEMTRALGLARVAEEKADLLRRLRQAERDLAAFKKAAAK